MTPAQELLAEIRDHLRALGFWDLLAPDTCDRVDTELARAAAPDWSAGPVPSEQLMRRLGLVRDIPGGPR